MLRCLDQTAFSVEAIVRGYHVYRDVWIELHCQREPFNAFAVAVVHHYKTHSNEKYRQFARFSTERTAAVYIGDILKIYHGAALRYHAP